MRKLNYLTLGVPLAGAFLALAALGGPVLAQEAVAEPENVLDEFIAADDPPLFDQPTGAVDAFKSALAADDLDGLAKLLGLDAAKLKAAEGVEDTFKQMKEGAAKRVVVAEKDGDQIIKLGDQLWPVPFPIAKSDDGKWAFDTYAGLDEVVDRRVGENETEAIATVRAYVDAQADYLAADRDGDGVLEYAKKLISTPGTTDGLFWPADQGNGESPAGAFADEGQKANIEADRGYFGYRFRVLTGQGDNIAGGKYDYVINDNMIAGFGLLAYPVNYGRTGVHSYVVSRDGIVYEADLGEETEKVASAMERFDPDDKWNIAKD